MSNGKTIWTDQQLKAITTAGRDVVVTASAGTGKTAVLSARCIELLSRAIEPADITEFLIMTFTEAAAEEMSSRIGQRLRSLYMEDRSPRLREQLLMLDAAQISTIHSFCQRLIREYFYLLGIDPTFGIIAEDEQKLIKSRVLEEIVEDAFNDSALSQGLNTLLFGRELSSGSMGFLDRAIGIYDFLDSTADRDKWYQSAEAICGDDTSGPMADRQRQIILEKLQDCLRQFEFMLRLDAELAGEHWAGQIHADMIAPVSELVDKVKQDHPSWATAIRDYKKPKFRNKPKDFDGDTADAVKAPAKKAFDIIAKLKDYALVNPRYSEIVAGAGSGQTKVLLELVKMFERKYTQAKRAINCLDFADLEHFALQLLTESDDVAEKFRERFKYVFVDEYQDINALQERIISLLGRGDNTFVVGDVKQSIYMFRHAEPGIFLDRLARAVDDSDSDKPLRVDLSKNFRSRKGVLDFANEVFGKIMTEDTAGLAYDGRAMLDAGFDYPEQESMDGPVVRIDVIDEEGFAVTDDEDDGDGVASDHVSTAQRQAALIAGRIQEMVCDEAFTVYDRASESYRPVRYGDIVILMRSLSGTAREYVELFRLAGIPVKSKSSAGYFAATEISDMVSLLKVLDNPQRDIELAAVLRSPLFKISDTELAMLRGFGKDGADFYQCVLAYSHDGPDAELREKIADVLAVVGKWTSAGRRGDLADLIWHVYRQTDYLSFVSAMPSGNQRRANLLKLHDRAIQFEGFADSASRTLRRFVEFIEELLDSDHDWAPAVPDSSGEDAVEIMSVHKSKGLEFPVVFLAETNHAFNMRDTSGQCLLDKAGAMGLTVVDRDSKLKFKTLAHQVIADDKTKETIAEEMRILYVAMTRARERLFITASKKRKQCEAIVSRCRMGADSGQISSARCHFDWMLYGLGGHKALAGLFNEGAAEISNELFAAGIYSSDEMDAAAREILYGQTASLKADAETDVKAIYDKVSAAIAWEYPNAADTQRKAKSSVSALTHRDDEYAASDYSASFDRGPGRGDSSNAMLVGSATHLLLQMIKPDQADKAGYIESVKAGLIEDGLVEKSVAGKINIAGVEAFFAGELGTLAKNNRTYREWPFTMLVDDMIVQGIVDYIIETVDGLVVVDFKTDSVNVAQAAKRAEKYAEQLKHYGDAAEKILNKTVTGKYVYFLKAQIAVEV